MNFEQTSSGLSGGLSGAMTGATMGSIIPGLGTAVGAIGGGLIGSLGGIFGSRKKKSSAVQPPAPPTGAQTGQFAKDYYDTAFPGTTMYERLGTSNPSGGIAETTMNTQNTSAISNSERKFQYDQLKLDTIGKMLDLRLKKNQVDISDQEMKTGQGRLKVEEGELQRKNKLLGSEEFRNRYGSISGALKSEFGDYAGLLLGAGGLSGALGAGARLGGLFKASKKANDAKKLIPGNMGKDKNSFKKGYLNPYTNKKVPD